MSQDFDKWQKYIRLWFMKRDCTCYQTKPDVLCRQTTGGPFLLIWINVNPIMDK